MMLLMALLKDPAMMRRSFRAIRSAKKWSNYWHLHYPFSCWS